jgi:hypothetical protein
MPAQRRLFMPADGLSIRDPLTNERAKGNIMNPRRYAEFGGLSSGSARGFFSSTATVQKPGATERAVPVK